LIKNKKKTATIHTSQHLYLNMRSDFFLSYVQNNRYSFMVYRRDVYVVVVVVFFFRSLTLMKSVSNFFYICVSRHLLKRHHLSGSRLTISIRLPLSLSHFTFLFKCHWFLLSCFFSFYLFLFIDFRFTAIWPLPSADQLCLLLLLLLRLFSNNNHTHLILTRLSMIDGLTSGFYKYIHSNSIIPVVHIFYTTVILRYSLAFLHVLAVLINLPSTILQKKKNDWTFISSISSMTYILLFSYIQLLRE
jgi:hypothetical protein